MTDAFIQIFVKADGEKTVLMEVSSKVKVRDVARRVLRTGESDQDVYVLSEGRMLEGSEEMGSCLSNFKPKPSCQTPLRLTLLVVLRFSVTNTTQFCICR